jgi:hypothetical protein
MFGDAPFFVVVLDIGGVGEAPGAAHIIQERGERLGELGAWS